MHNFFTHIKNKTLEFFGLMTRYEADLMAFTATTKAMNNSSDTYQILATAYNKLEKQNKEFFKELSKEAMDIEALQEQIAAQAEIIKKYEQCEELVGALANVFCKKK